MSVFKKIKIKIITQSRATSASRWGQCYFMKNFILHVCFVEFIGLKSKLFYLRKVNWNSLNLHGKNTLTLNKYTNKPSKIIINYYYYSLKKKNNKIANRKRQAGTNWNRKPEEREWSKKRQHQNRKSQAGREVSNWFV